MINMLLETRMAIRNNIYYYNFLRENSYWYKYLNRSHSNLIPMDKEVKNYYKLNFSDKLNDLSNKMNMINNFIELLK